VVRYGIIALLPLVFIVVYIFVVGAIAQKGMRGIVPGGFPRDLRHPWNNPRHIYAACWKAVSAFAPLYFICLKVPFLKTMLLRIFGYHGSLDVGVSADVVIPEWAMLNCGPRVILGRGAALGTTLRLQDEALFTDPITLSQGVILGQQTLVGPGVSLDRNTWVDQAAMIGMRCRTGEGAKIGAGSTLLHGVTIGKATELGRECFVGLRTELGEGLKVPSGLMVPPGLRLVTQGQIDELRAQELRNLKELRSRLLRSRLGGIRRA